MRGDDDGMVLQADEVGDHPHLQECLRFFNNDWVSLEHKVRGCPAVSGCDMWHASSLGRALLGWLSQYTADGYVDIPQPSSLTLPQHRFEVDCTDAVSEVAESDREEVDPGLLAQYFNCTEEELSAERVRLKAPVP